MDPNPEFLGQQEETMQFGRTLFASMVGLLGLFCSGCDKAPGQEKQNQAAKPFDASTPTKFFESYCQALKGNDADSLSANVYGKQAKEKMARLFRERSAAYKGKSDDEVILESWRGIVRFDEERGEAEELKLVSVQETGDRATITYDRRRGSYDDKGMEMKLIKEAGRWWESLPD